MGNRIIIIGTSGSGKSTLARKLSQRFNISHIELDNLYWGSNWTLNPDFRKAVEFELDKPEWVICGNHSSVRNLIWSQATLLIWLDYSFYLVFWRALKRSIKRIIYKQIICGGIENLYQGFSLEILFCCG